MFDGGVFLGRNPTNGNELTEEDLISLFDEFHIEKAIVSHYQSVFGDFREGNENLLALYRKYPGKIIPSVIISSFGFDISKGESYLDELKASGVRILGVYSTPRYYEIQLESLLLRKIAEMASKKGLFLQFGLEFVSDLYKVVDYYGHLPTKILIRWMNGRGYFNLAEIINVCKICPNFYFDIGAINDCGGIEYLIREVGAGRFYFASNIPDGFRLTSHMLVQTADVTGDELHQIYSKTLASILNEDVCYSISETKQSISSSWSNLLSRPKIDCHWHYDSWNLIDQNRDIQILFKNIHKFNFQKVVVASARALNYDLVTGNEQVRMMAEEDKSQTIYGYIVVDPLRVEDSIQEIEKYAQHSRFVGIKTIQDLYGFRLNHRNYGEIFRVAERYNMPVLVHIPGLKEAAEEFSGVRFVVAHSTWERVRHLVSARNVYFELATSHNDVAETRLEWLIENAGVERILFGSDAQLISPAWTLGKIASSKVDQTALKKILFENALSVFSRLQ